VDIEKIDALRLGKQQYRYDERTLRMMAVLDVPLDVKVPKLWDFDAKRSKLPFGLWGNDEFGDCVLVGRGNHLVRNERVETRKTIPLTTEMVVNEYKRLTGCVTAGDPNDTGLVVLEAIKAWRSGWPLPIYKGGRTYGIEAYGELDKLDREQLRSAAYLLNGIQFGIGLPRTAYDQLRKGQVWDDTGLDVPVAQPWSWGGHLVYAKKYDEGGFTCITWGQEQYMTNRFIERYADEAWAVVDKLNTAGKYIDIQKLLKYLRDIGATVGG
jgi:hypothetical protein